MYWYFNRVINIKMTPVRGASSNLNYLKALYHDKLTQKNNNYASHISLLPNINFFLLFSKTDAACLRTCDNRTRCHVLPWSLFITAGQSVLLCWKMDRGHFVRRHLRSMLHTDSLNNQNNVLVAND